MRPAHRRRIGLQGTVTIRLAGDDEVRALNRKYRRKDRATDVLSFPLGEKLPGGFYAGDILICWSRWPKSRPGKTAIRWKRNCCC